MPKLRNVTVATDFSPSAMLAVERAASLPFVAGRGRLRIVHVIPRDRVLAATIETARVRLQESERAARLVAARSGNGQLHVSSAIAHGDPADMIAHWAMLEPADLIVVGRTGKAGLRLRVLGSTAERVIRQSVRPVLVVSNAGSSGYARALVAVDVHDGSIEAAEFARRIVGPQGAIQGVVRAYRFEGARKSALEGLRGTLERWGEDEPDFEITLRRGDQTRVILDAARERRADLLVLGTRAHAGIDLFKYGSVSAKVVRRAPCDVLVARTRTGRARAGLESAARSA